MTITTTAATGMSDPTVFNRKGIRNAVFRQLDWAPSQSDTAKNRANEFIQRAYNRLTQDAPYMFFEEQIRWPVFPDAEPGGTSGGTTDLLRIAPDVTSPAKSADAWTLQTELSTSVAASAGRTVWQSDKSWNGREIMLKASGTTTWHIFRIREVWDETIDGTEYTRITLSEPWANITDTGMDWRVISNEFVFPDNLMEVKSVSLLENTTQYPYPLAFVSQSQAESSLMPNNTSLTPAGAPRYIYRRESQQIAAPTKAPVISAKVGIAWAGPEPEGEFEYVYTYAWGYQENGVRKSTSGGPSLMTTTTATLRTEPYWESAPSPISDRALVSDGSTTSVAIDLPHLAHMLGFYGSGTNRYGRTGMYIRIYRRRISASTTGTFTEIVESPNTFYYLGNASDSPSSYVDSGATLPDYNRPLRVVHGYETFRLHPRPNARMDLTIRAIVNPRPLTDDSDVPRIHEDGMDCLVLRTLAYMYETQGNNSAADRALRQYDEALMQLGKRHGTLKPSGRPITKRTARVRRRWRPRNQPLVDDAT